MAKRSEREIVFHSCKFCTPIAYRGDERENVEMRRFFCFGRRKNPSPADPLDKHNFCVYTPFKGIVQFHVEQGDIDWWLALFLAAWREITGKDEIFWPAIEAMADMVSLCQDKAKEGVDILDKKPRGNVNGG